MAISEEIRSVLASCNQIPQYPYIISKTPTTLEKRKQLRDREYQKVGFLLDYSRDLIIGKSGALVENVKELSEKQVAIYRHFIDNGCKFVTDMPAPEICIEHQGSYYIDPYKVGIYLVNYEEVLGYKKSEDAKEDGFQKGKRNKNNRD